MDTVLEILKYILPSLIVLAGTIYLIRIFLENDHKQRIGEAGKENKQMILTLRLQAYERLVLLLERISPGQILFRLNQPGMTAYQLHAALMQNIRDEFEHNLAQQIYVSPKAWTNVKSAKEEVVRLINTALADMKEASNANDFARVIFEKWAGQEKDPVQASFDILRAEVAELL